MPIRFQADADLNQIIVSAVLRRVPAIDFRTGTAAGLAVALAIDWTVRKWTRSHAAPAR